MILDAIAHTIKLRLINYGVVMPLDIILWPLSPVGQGPFLQIVRFDSLVGQNITDVSFTAK